MEFVHCPGHPDPLNNSILANVKQSVGFEIDDTSFDTEFLTSIGSSIFTLRQLGLAVPKGFAVKSLNETWDDLTNREEELEAIRAYLQKKARLDVDPPTSSYAIQALERQISELEFRIESEVDPAFKIPSKGGASE